MATSSSPQTMLAARFHGPHNITLDRIPIPPLPPTHILIHPSHVGICGTDLHEFTGGPTFAPTTPHPLTHESIPIGFGHEFSGRIAALPPNPPLSPFGRPFTLGMKVAVQPTLSCGTCSACAADVENVCPRGGFIGLSGGGGGLSEAVAVRASHVFPVAERMGLDEAALIEPLSVAHHAVAAAPLRERDAADVVVLVLGGGPIGLAVLQVLRALGVRRVLVSEVAAQRQAFARDFGASEVWDPSKVDVVEKCQGLEGGGVDIAFDCAGLAVTLKTACHAIRARGTVVNVAIWENEVGFNPNWLVFREGRYCAVLGYQGKDYAAVIRLMEEGKIDAKAMITARIKLEDLVEKGIKPLLTEKEKHVKILVDLGASGLAKVESATI